MCSKISVRSVRKNANFRSSDSCLNTVYIVSNVNSMMEISNCPRFSKIDEVAAEDSVDIEISSGIITGFYFEHGSENYKKLNCIENAINSKDKLFQAKIHREKECSLIFIGKVG